MEVGVKDTIGPLDQDALQHGSMMPDGWQAEIEPPNDRDERESANDPSSATGTLDAGQTKDL